MTSKLEKIEKETEEASDSEVVVEEAPVEASEAVVEPEPVVVAAVVEPEPVVDPVVPVVPVVAPVVVVVFECVNVRTYMLNLFHNQIIVF